MSSPNTLEGLPRMSDVEVARDSHHYIVLSQLNRWIMTRAVPFSRGTLLDYGCGGQPYRKLFVEKGCNYIGADVTCAAGISLDVKLVPGVQAPLADASVDTILSTQVLEHVYDFHGYLEDCRRLLRAEGRLILTVPMQWRHHEVPSDYWRFTRFAVERMLRETGFQTVELTPCGGVYSLLGQVFLDHLAERRQPRPWLNRLVNRLSLFADKRIQDCNETLVWMCLAEKA